MEYEIFNSENCYICNELMGSFKSALNVVTGYSERPIYQIIGNFSIKLLKTSTMIKYDFQLIFNYSL